MIGNRYNLYIIFIWYKVGVKVELIELSNDKYIINDQYSYGKTYAYIFSDWKIM